jgi:RNA polymerase sigma factor (sigma-70 family)
MNYLGDLYLSKAIEELKRSRNGECMAKVLYLRYWGKLTLEDIGEQLSLSKERIRQIEMRALRMLKAKLKNSDLADFLDATI